MGNKEFNIVVLPIQDKLFRFAVSILKNIENAEDALQEVLIKLWKLRDEWYKYNNMEAFAMRMMKNYCIDRLRTAKNTLNIDNCSICKDDTTPEKLAIIKDSVNIAYRIIEQLPNTQQMIIRLRDVEDYSFEEISEIMEMQPNTVRTNLSRARQTVREQLLKVEMFDLQTKN